MISQLATLADEVPVTEFGFDGPVDSYSIIGEISVSLGVAGILAVPGFFIGMLVHRLFARMPIAARLLVVGGLAVTFWFSVWQFVDDLIFVAAFFAVLASLFDGLRVNEDRSSERFTKE